jgi:hypothetical protein
LGLLCAPLSCVFALASYIEPAFDLRVVVFAECGILLGFEFIQYFVQDLTPGQLTSQFLASLPLLLGPRPGDDAEKVIRQTLDLYRSFSGIFGSRPLGPVDVSGVYFYSDGLQTFQGTLSCIYQNSRRVAELIDANVNIHPWILLDIGGGEGRFTAELIKALKNRPTYIYLLEPGEKELQEYKQLLNDADKRIAVTSHLGSAPHDVAAVPEVDVVLASHSLYSIFDDLRDHPDRICETLQNILLKSKKKLAVLTFASRDSHAYQIKSTVLQKLGIEDKSFFGEDLSQACEGRFISQRQIQDSVIDVTRLLESRENMALWVSYFCRIPVERLRDYYVFCHDVIFDVSISYSHLPESVRSEVAASGAEDRLKLERESRVVLHKEVVSLVFGTVATQGE